MVKRKTRSRDCFGFANNIYEEAFKELYNLSSYKRPFETLCLLLWLAWYACWTFTANGKQQKNFSHRLRSAVCTLM